MTQRKHDADNDYYMHRYSNQHEFNSDKEYESRDKETQARIAMLRAAKQQTGKTSLRTKELDKVFGKGK